MSRNWLRETLLTVLVCVSMGATQAVMAAYCSLRDPVLAINSLYPAADSYRSIVRPVNQDARKQIGSSVPFTLHQNEIGKHTLFMILKEQLPIGFIHARSELIDWGMIELAWAINLNLTIDGFYFQRCRSPRCTGDLIDQVLQDVKGRRAEELYGLLDSKGENLAPALVDKYGSDHALVLAIVRSAIKTLLVTEITWREDIKKMLAGTEIKSAVRTD